VEDEFREFLTCGVLAHGCARLRCEGGGLDRLLPFSCKGRGFCPGCGGRRMAERAAPAVDAVLPHVPIRQWVLSLPHWLRYVLAWDHTTASVASCWASTCGRCWGSSAGGRGGSACGTVGAAA
jgi:hypothetical protein